MSASGESLARSAILCLTEELRAGHDPTARSTARMLERLFPDTELHFVDIDPSANDVAVATTAGVADSTYLRRLVSVIGDHPLIRSHLPLTWKNARPRRMSDVISQRELRRTQTYNELLRPTGITHQVAIMTSIRGTRGTAWVVNRGGSDIAQRELDIATALQPSLAILQCVFDRNNDRVPVVRDRESENRYHLTKRELQVLGLTSDGLTALHVAHALNISLRTVRKHLENAYAKLDAHDRLLAVTRARAAHLID